MDNIVGTVAAVAAAGMAKNDVANIASELVTKSTRTDRKGFLLECTFALVSDFCVAINRIDLFIGKLSKALGDYVGNGL
jgi:hypothetical protein